MRRRSHYVIRLSIAGGFGSITEVWIKDKSPENVLTTVEIYDPETNSWSTGPDPPMPLCAMGVVKYYGTIYLLGRKRVDKLLEYCIADIPSDFYFF